MRISDWSSDVCSSDLEPPARHLKHGLSEGGRQHRHDHEDAENEAHKPRHLRSLIAVANDRHEQHPCRRCGDALTEASGEQHLEATRLARSEERVVRTGVTITVTPRGGSLNYK